MPKKKPPHPYSEKPAFERLMLLIATLLKYPGVGSAEPLATRDREENHHHNALEDVQQKLRALAQSLNIELPPDYPSPPTIRKDLKILREYGILDHRMYRWGYYLGTGVFSPSELRFILNLLQSYTVTQKENKARQLYQEISQRLKGFSDENSSDFFYPLRHNLNRTIEWTDPSEMMEKGQYRHTLFHCLDTIETAILEGQALEISRFKDPYNDHGIGLKILWILQIIYYNTAWYILYEECKNSCLGIGRISRFKDYCEIITQKGRGITAQKQSLDQAHQLLENGWGLNLGNMEEQRLELENKLNFIQIKVRFFPPASYFILEGELRHIQQKITKGKLNHLTKQPEYIDYQIELPPRSVNEFSLWLQKYGDQVQVLVPSELVEKHKNIAHNLLNRYN